MIAVKVFSYFNYFFKLSFLLIFQMMALAYAFLLCSENILRFFLILIHEFKDCTFLAITLYFLEHGHIWLTKHEKLAIR